MLAKILKRHASRDHIVGGNVSHKMSPSKGSIAGSANSAYSANNATNGSHPNVTFSVRWLVYIEMFMKYLKWVLNNIPVNNGFYSLQFSNNNYPFSMLTSVQIYWETILNLSITSFPVMQRDQWLNQR